MLDGFKLLLQKIKQKIINVNVFEQFLGLRLDLLLVEQ